MSTPASNPDFLFVYGSLMTSQGQLDRLGVSRYVRRHQPASIAGRLYDLGEFPGLIIPHAEESTTTLSLVPGELLEVIDPAGYAILDEYEAYYPNSPETSLFRRVRLTLHEPAVVAWVYVFAGPIEGHPRVIDESWPDYVARRGQHSN